MKKAIGIDIGGSHIAAAIVDLNGPEIINESYHTDHLNTNQSPGIVVDRWVETIKRTAQHIDPEDLAGIGFSMPGPFDYERGISGIHNQNKYEQLFGLSVKHSLLNRLPADWKFGIGDIRFLNDAQGFLMGAVWERGWLEQKVIGLTLGTGFGSAFYDCRTGKVRDGKLWSAPYQGGIAEDLISTRWFVDTFNAKSEHQVENVKQIAERYEDSGIAREVFAEFGKNLGEFLCPIVQDFQPRAIIFGGNILRAYDYFKKTLLEALAAPGLEIAISFDTEVQAILGSVRCFSENITAAPSPTTFDILLPDNKEVNLAELSDWLKDKEQVIFTGATNTWDTFAGNLNRQLISCGIKANWFASDYEKLESSVLRPEKGQLNILFGNRAGTIKWEGPVIKVKPREI